MHPDTPMATNRQRAANAGELPQRYHAVRARTDALAAPLSAEDCCVQSMPDASPVKWHLAHTTWFFETFVLERFEPGFKPYDTAFRVLFNSYYNGVGDKHPRPQRGMLTRPSLKGVRDYRQNVDVRVQALLELRAEDTQLRDLVVLGLNHEQQHQELLLTDIKHLLSLNPLRPAYHEHSRAPRPAAGPLQWIAYPGGVVEIGYDGDGFAFDNEAPRHSVYLQPWMLASRPVTNGEFLRFVEAGGYTDPQLWLSEAWDWVKQGNRSHPLYWRHENRQWSEFGLSGTRALDPDQPVVHVSYFEADAYARWAHARLPTEAEWEHAATQCAIEGNFADSGRFHPVAANTPGLQSAQDQPPLLQQMYGDIWEWTQSSYAPYPGFHAADGALGEYNGKFMVNQYVLRGGSCATPADHIRPSYRNFFPASANWQFTGIRLARDAPNASGRRHDSSTDGPGSRHAGRAVKMQKP